MITGKWYDRLKFVAMVGLPAFATFYLAVGSIWGLPATEQVVGTVVALDTFLGGLLQISANRYANSDARFDGDIVVSDLPDGRKNFSLELNDDPHLLENRSELLFKLKPGAPLQPPSRLKRAPRTRG